MGEITATPAERALVDAVKLFDEALSVSGTRVIRAEDVLTWMVKHMSALSAAAEACGEVRPHG